MKKESELFDLFVGQGYGDWTEEPFEYDGYVTATDGVIALRIPKHLCEGEYNTQVRNLRCGGCEANHLVTLTELEDLLSKCPTEPEMRRVGQDVVCTECDGTGRVFWEYRGWEQEGDCPVCHGSGLEEEATEVETGKLTYPTLRGLRFTLQNQDKGSRPTNYVISERNIFRIVRAMKILELKSARVGLGSIPGMMRLELPDCIEILVMEVRSDDIDGKIVLKVTPKKQDESK